MNVASRSTTVGEIVAADLRAAGIFEQFGIEFCCLGRRSFAEACEAAAADPAAVEQALAGLSAGDGRGDERVSGWSVEQLIDRIVGTHHAYVARELPVIAAHLAKLVKVHGERHPELARVAAAFDHMGRDLVQHMMKEERVLFPYIRDLASHAGDQPAAPSPFGTIENPIRMMEREHRDSGDEMRMIRELTHGYTVPADACTTYRVTFDELDRFERDLHRHVHLENHVLFPKAVALERGQLHA